MEWFWISSTITLLLLWWLSSYVHRSVWTFYERGHISLQVCICCFCILQICASVCFQQVEKMDYSEPKSRVKQAAVSVCSFSGVLEAGLSGGWCGNVEHFSLVTLDSAGSPFKDRLNKILHIGCLCLRPKRGLKPFQMWAAHSWWHIVFVQTLNWLTLLNSCKRILSLMTSSGSMLKKVCEC